MNGEAERTVALDRLLHDAAERTPAAPAVIELDAHGQPVSCSYADLLTRTQAFAAALCRAGVRPGDRVVVDAPNTANTIAMLLACSTTGASFVPLTDEIPNARARQVIAACAPQVYTHPAGSGRLHQLTERPNQISTVAFGVDGCTVRAGNDREPTPPLAGADGLAYVIFTSGSTGVPKGVAMPQQASYAFFAATRGLLSAGDRVASTAPLHFDFCLLDIGVCLANGAAIVPVRRDWLRWPRRFVATLRGAECTRVHAVPSVWRPLVRRQPELLRELPPLDAIMYTGEPFPADELAILHEALPNTRIVNCYGPTECMACSFTDVTPFADGTGGETAPIDGTYPGSILEIVDERGRVLSTSGASGQLRFTGPSIFAGYWESGAGVRPPESVYERAGSQRSLLTGDFARRGTDGRLRFEGRRDRQVKIAGNRVELSEIESVLGHVSGIEEARVIPLYDGTLTTLVAYVAGPAADPRAQEAACRQACLDRLPPYMRPVRVLLRTELPKGPNGKVDQSRLIHEAATGRPHRPEEQ